MTLRTILPCLALTTSVFVGCADTDSTESDPEVFVDGPSTPTPAQPSEPAPADPGPAAPSSHGLCGDLTSDLGALPEDTIDAECLATFTEQCEAVVGVVSPDYVAAVQACVAEGTDIFTCLAEGLGALEPKLAHLTLAEAFCEECALDVPGCEDLFFFEGEAAGIGVLTLPFSEELIAEVTAECTDGFTCAVDFPGCARDVLEERLANVEGLLCVLDL